MAMTMELVLAMGMTPAMAMELVLAIAMVRAITIALVVAVAMAMIKAVTASGNRNEDRFLSSGPVL